MATTERTLVTKGMSRVATVCLLAIAVNAVLIQTVVADEDSPLKNIVRAGVLALVVFALLLNGTYVPLGIFCLALASFVLLILRNNPDQLSFIFVLILAVALFTVEERRLEKRLLLASMVSLGLVFVFLGAGITENEIIELRQRSTFGTNGVPFFYNLVYGAFTMLVLFTQKHAHKRRRFLLLLSLMATTYFFQQTDARGGYFSFLTFVVLLFLVPRLSRVRLFRLIVTLVPVIFLLASFYIATLSDDVTANRLLSRRPILFDLFLRNVGLADFLFSTTVKQFDRATTIVDNSYLHLLVGGGLILCVAFFFIFGQAVRNLFAQGRHVEIAFLIATCAYFNSESILLRIENMFVIYFWYLILRHSRFGPPSPEEPGGKIAVGPEAAGLLTTSRR